MHAHSIHLDPISATLNSVLSHALSNLYYLTYTGPPKCVMNLRMLCRVECVFGANEHMLTSGGNQPLCACSTEFVAHRVAALERVANQLWCILQPPRQFQ